jgi:hypothetical protein
VENGIKVLYWKKEFSQSKAAKDLRVITANSIGNFYRISKELSNMQYYYMTSITSGEMADCDWLRCTFSGAS